MLHAFLEQRTGVKLTIGALAIISVLFAGFTVAEPENWNQSPEQQLQSVRVDSTVTRSVLGDYSVSIDHVQAHPMTILVWDAVVHNTIGAKLGLLSTDSQRATVTITSPAGETATLTHNTGSFATFYTNSRTFTVVFLNLHTGEYHLTVNVATSGGEPLAHAEQDVEIIGE
jgi:hypothetical protein